MKHVCTIQICDSSTGFKEVPCCFECPIVSSCLDVCLNSPRSCGCWVYPSLRFSVTSLAVIERGEEMGSILTVRLNDILTEKLNALVNNSGLNISDYVRELIAIEHSNLFDIKLNSEVS